MLSSLLIILLGLVSKIAGHGMLLDPPNRSSRWRMNESAPINYNDNQNFCGGFWVQHHLNGGKCGVCGDSYTEPHPQNNENTGKYGDGVVVAKYTPGSIIETEVLITANHLGYYTFSLCVLEDPHRPEEGEYCFIPLFFEDGSLRFKVNRDDHMLLTKVQLPNIECERCVLRWTYTAGNNWGICEDGTTGLGCGPQEHFRSCSDISIMFII